MKNDIDDIARQQQSLLTFSFDQENDKIFIMAESENNLYTGFLETSPLITYDKIQKALSGKNYEIVSKDNQQIQITIGGVIDFKLKSLDQPNLEFLKLTIQKLTAKVAQVEKKVQKSIKIEQIIKEMQNQILQIKNTQQEQKNIQKQKNIIFTANNREQKNQFDIYNNTQRQAIQKIQFQIFQLRENILKQKEQIDDNSSKITLDHQELKQMILLNSQKINQLQTEENKTKNLLNINQRENDQHTENIFFMVSAIEQEIKKTSKQIENLENKLYSQDQKQYYQISEFNKPIQNNKKRFEYKKDENIQKINQNSVGSFDQEKNQKITQLTAQMNELRTQLNQLITQTIPKCLFLIQEPQFMKFSRVVCSFEEKYCIKQFFEEKTIKSTKLLYRASQNDFSVAKFHQKCDGIRNTLTVICTEFHKKIGAFTPLKWSSSGDWSTDEQKVSFIFSLTHNDKFTLQQSERAIYNFQNYGPRFGVGADLAVYDKSNSNNSYANICSSYHNQNYKHQDKVSYERFHGGATGSKNFKTVEWQVWELEWA